MTGDQPILLGAATLIATIDHAIDPDRCTLPIAVIRRLEDLREQCRAFRWAWPLRLETVPLDRLDRCRPLLGGPLFTSADFPWPDAAGRPMEPIVQIDLAEAGAIGGVALGEGLLQLWMAGTDGHLRLIPMEQVRGAALSPVPEDLVACGYEEWFNHRDEGDARPAWLGGAFAITGTEDRRLAGPPMLKTILEEALALTLPARLRNAVEALDRLVPDPWPGSEPHYFGHFDAIQYDVEDKPPTLLALESGGAFQWGDAGNAQIFYRIPNGGAPMFEMDWSCA